MPRPSELIELLKNPNPDLERRPNDIIPGRQSRPDIGDDDALSAYLQKITKQDIQDRDNFDFIERQAYNDRAYFEVKDAFFNNWPWPKSSNYPVPITPTLVDVGWAHIQASMFRNPMKTVLVSGVGKEDKPYAPFVAHVLNFENGVESEIYDVQGTNAFRTLLRGTGFIKTWLDIGDEFKLRHASVPMQLVYKPIRGNGCHRDKCDHISQFIPLNESDWKFRMGLKINGKPVYEHLDMIAPGFEPSESLTTEEMRLLQNQVTGMDVETSDARDYRWMVETHLTYYPPGKFKAVEIIIHWSLRHGLIHRVIENDPEYDDKIRPLSDYWVYPSDGYAYQRSLPEVIRHIQEKANYTDKQKTDTRDMIRMPPGFIDKGSGFDPLDHVLMPNAMYEVKPGTNIQFPQRSISPTLADENELDKLWDQAKTRTGFTDIFQGLEAPRSGTLGGDRIRLNKAENRFKTVLNTFGIGWRRTAEIQYTLTDRHIPRKKLIAILGSSDYTNVDQFFPGEENQEGMGLTKRRFNFALAGKPQSEADREEEEVLAMTGEVLASPFGQQEAVAWRMLKRRAEIRNYEQYEIDVPKPPSAEIMSAEEVLQKIESGEVEIRPSPLMDLQMIEYVRWRLMSFKNTQRYENYTTRQKVVLERYLFQMEEGRKAKELAKWSKMAEQDPLVGQALSEVMSEIQSGQVPAEAVNAA